MGTKPDEAQDSEALVRRARAAHRDGRLAEAAADYRRVLQSRPDHALAWFGLGSVSAQQGRFHSAILDIERAMAIGGPRAEMQHNIAGAKAGLGRFAEAQAHFREALRLRPDYAEACYNYSQLRLAPADRQQLLDTIEHMLAAHERPDVDRCFLHFAAGKLLDECAEYERAFRHYQAGNAAKGYHYDPAAVDAGFAAIAEVFSHERIRQLAAHGHADDRFVFIVGMPRSGTSLVEQILAAHPATHAAGELPDMAAISQTLPRHAGTAWPGVMQHLTPALVRGFGEAYARQVGARAPRARRITDKMPLNFRFLGLIAVLLPGARVIHCQRNPADTCLSGYFQNFRGNHEYSFSLAGLGHYYPAYRRLMAHWEAVLPTPPLQVSYEALTDDIEAGARRLLDYLDLPWDERCLRFNEVERAVTTASRWQVRQPVYRSSRQRWRHYAPWLTPLTDALRTAGLDF